MTHELSLINNLLEKIREIAQNEKAEKVTCVRVRLGAMSHISADHFREHFYEGVKGTLVDGADLIVTEDEDVNDPQAQSIVLESVDVEEKKE